MWLQYVQVPKAFISQLSPRTQTLVCLNVA